MTTLFGYDMLKSRLKRGLLKKTLPLFLEMPHDNRMTVQMTNTGISQRAALQAQIWNIANEVRGVVDGWDFKQFVLGTLFYRFIS